MYLCDFFIYGCFKFRGDDNGGVQYVGLCKVKNWGCLLCFYGNYLIGYRFVDVFFFGFSKLFYDFLYLYVCEKVQKI